LRSYGAQLGLAFQLVDDIMGIWGDPAVTGKPVHSDLRARKKSLPVSYALNEGGPAGRELATWLSAPLSPGGAAEHGEAELLHVASLIETAGGRQWAAAKAADCMKYGQAALEGVELDGTARGELIALGHFIVNRNS
jgi:geranylgeranyl diphosphate synthase type I